MEAKSPLADLWFDLLDGRMVTDGPQKTSKLLVQGIHVDGDTVWVRFHEPSSPGRGCCSTFGRRRTLRDVLVALRETPGSDRIEVPHAAHDHAAGADGLGFFREWPLAPDSGKLTSRPVRIIFCEPTPVGKEQLSSATAAAAFAESVRSRGGTVVFTNGVFDLLHPGHIRYLRDARALGDALIVAVNSDRSVRSNKGEDQQINPEAERVEVLLALECVDAAVIFDDDTARHHQCHPARCAGQGF